MKLITKQENDKNQNSKILDVAKYLSYLSFFAVVFVWLSRKYIVQPKQASWQLEDEEIARGTKPAYDLASSINVNVTEPWLDVVSSKYFPTSNNLYCRRGNYRSSSLTEIVKSLYPQLNSKEQQRFSVTVYRHVKPYVYLPGSIDCLKAIDLFCIANAFAVHSPAALDTTVVMASKEDLNPALTEKIAAEILDAAKNTNFTELAINIATQKRKVYRELNTVFTYYFATLTGMITGAGVWGLEKTVSKKCRRKAEPKRERMLV